MNKIILSLFLGTISIGAYANDTGAKKQSSTVSENLCNNVKSQSSLAENNDPVFVSMDYYREYENKEHELLKESLSSFTLVNNSSEAIPFGVYSNSRYLVSIKYKGQEINDGTRYVDEEGNIKPIKYPFENKSLQGNIYTSVSNNEVSMKLCINRAIENQNTLNTSNSIYNNSTYEQKNVKFNQPTIISLDNGYKLKITFHQYKVHI